MSELDRYVDLSRRLLVELDSRDRALARQREPIAIVGMACRFPGGEDLRAFEDLLRHGRDAIVPVPEGRWAGHGSDASDPDRTAPRRGGFLEGIDEFDAGFFRVAPVEAALLDPQQRLLLETSWRALEDAGLDPDRLRGSRTGVFAGIATTDYRELVALSADAASRYLSTGTFASTAAGRIAFALGLEGPTMAIDTACSSSLVALHQAVTALQREEADLALAGGVNAILSAAQMAAFANAGMLAPDGRCKTFDARADGYVRGEGCGMVVLRRLGEAEAAGDRILAVIRGSAVNQDGASAGLTVPNGTAQEGVIRAALARAGVEPAEVDYLEAHGTGTELGDPIEVRAASAVYGEGRPAGRPLLVGSVKTNIGHLEAAAGIAGVIKVVLALHRGAIPAHLNFRTPNPRLDWSSLPVRVTAQPTPWPETEGRPRRAGVSSFGFSGTNAHLVLEGRDAPEGGPVPLPEGLVEAPGERPVRVLPVSARSASAVPALARRYLAWLDGQDRPASRARLADFAWTAGAGRSQLAHRAGLAFRNEAELRDALAPVASGARPAMAGTVERVGFLFTGQGSQWPGMGRPLYESEPVFRSVLDRCDAIVRATRGASLIEAMFGGGDLDDTAWTQPALYALACGLAALWEGVGVRPAAVLGHSVGELAAAHVAGVFSLEDGARFAAMRGAAMAELAREPGSMAAVFAPVAKVREAMDAADAAEDLSLAAENGTHCVVSGPSRAMEGLGAACRSAGLRFQPLRTRHAFHSALMEPALDAIESGLAGIAMARPTVPLVGNVSGRVLEGVPDGAYWCRQARATVRFSAGVSTLAGLGVDLLIEVGPDAVLGRLAQACWPGDGEQPPAVASLTADTSFGEAVAAAWEAGLPFSFGGLFTGETRRRIAIPGHPFERRRYWLDDRPRRSRPEDRPGLGIRTRLANGEVVFDQVLSASSPPWLNDHAVFGLVVVPGALWAVMAGVAPASESGPESGLESDAKPAVAVEEARLHAPLILADAERRTVQTVLGAPDAEGGRSLAIYSQGEDRAAWIRHFETRLRPWRPGTADPTRRTPGSIVAEMGPADPEHHYRSLAAAGMAYGLSFRRVGALWVGSGEAVVEVALAGEPAAGGVAGRSILLDGCLQAVPAAAGEDDLFLPFGWDRLWLADALPERVWGRARITGTGDEVLRADLELMAGDGTLLGAIEGFAAKRATRPRLLAAGARTGGPLQGEAAAPPGDRGPATSLLARLRAATKGEREALLATTLQAEVQAVLRLPEPPSPNVGFFDLGMDSLSAVAVRNRLNRLLEGAYTLSSTAAFDFPDIGKLARHLVAALDPDLAVAPPPARRRRPKADGRIAIVGIGCRFPGGEGPEAFRALLEEGRSAIGPFPSERWPREPAEAAIGGDRAAFRGGYIDGIDRFDAAFFRIAPVEARHLDPQQRLLLETAWHALEDAGIDPQSLRGSRTGVLAGVMNNDYRDLLAAGPEATSAWLASGTMDSTAIGRVAFALGLEGPALAVDTACSSSLVAIHQAIAALEGGEADLMLAGGVNAVLSPVFTRSLVNAGMLAADGRCKTFDARADGYGRGEGCGVVVLKRLADAEADGDRIRAVLLGSAVNHDGASAGLTVPNGPAQERVIAAALARAGVEPAEVDYLEAHGTGTALGDPIEVHAAAAVYGVSRPADRPLMIGSVKTNVGHLEGAAGVAGLVKIVLAMESGTIPRHLGFESPNPRVDWERLPVRVVAEPAPWPATAGHPPRAGLSSFGFSGTNAHLVVEAWPGAGPAADAGGPPAEPEPARAVRLLPLSGRTGAAVRDLAQRHLEWLDRAGAPASGDPSFLADLAWSASVGRSRLEHREAVVFADRSELRRGLTEIARAEPASSPGTVAKVAFLFTGQGSQWPGMGRTLYRSEPVFRAVLDRCETAFRDLTGESLLEVMFDTGETGDLDDTARTQPALYALECGLAELWSHVGVRPAAVLGHSVGEIAAARTAGVFGLEDGLRLAAGRGRAMSRLPGDGAMAAVFAAPDRVAEWLAGSAGVLSLAADNGTHQVVSGPRPALDELTARLAADGVRVSRLATSHAFHSAMMDPALDEIERLAGAMTAAPPALPLIGNVTGEIMREAPDGAYWRRHAREPVAFAAGARTLAGLEVDALLEIGPQPVLGPLAREAWPGGRKPVVVASQHREVSNPDGGFSAAAAAALWRAGLALDLRGLFEGESRRRRSLPLYPFQRRRHWVDAETRPPRGTTGSASPGWRTDLASGETLFEMTLSETSPDWLADHRVFEHIVAPAALWGALAVEMSSSPQGVVAVEDLQILAPLVVEDGPRTVQATAGVRDAGRGRALRIHSRGAGEADWTLHAEGRLVEADPVAEPAGAHHSPEADEVPLPGFYESLAAAGIRYGSAFRRLGALHASDGRASGRLAAPAGVSMTERLDGCFQVLAAAAGIGGDRLYLPVAWRRLWLAGPLPDGFACQARLAAGEGSAAPTGEDSATLTGDLDLFDEAGAKIGEIRGLALRRASRQTLLAAGVEGLLHEPTWRPARPGPSRSGPAARPMEGASGSPRAVWVVAADGSGLAPALASSLAAEGQRVILAGEALAPAAEPPGAVDRIALPVDRDAWRALFADLRERLRGVVWLSTAADGEAGPAAAVERTALGALAMIQGLDASGVAAPAGLSFVTRGAQVLGYECAEGLAGAALWGLGRTARVEAGHLGLRLLDLDPAGDGATPDLVAELLSPDRETEIAWRNGERQVARLVRSRSARRPVPFDRGWRLAADPEGVLSGLRFEEAPPRAPGPGEVRLAVEAAGINFHDVLAAMRLVDADSPLGGDVCGRVIETGPDVTEHTPGDRVMGIAAGSFASEATTDARLLTAVPPGLSGLAAAGLPSVYVTVALAFEQAALEPGDRVLIHAAAGGVGHAAIALGRAMGARLFATASAGKREYVRSLGVPHVFDSREPSFAAPLLEATGGRGVDIVLNSLTGPGFIEASLSCLGPGGRFVELSKRDIRTAGEMAAARPDVDYSVLAVDELAGSDPARVGRALRAIAEKLRTGDLPPLPCAAWPVTEAVRAMEAMQAGGHRGKLVLTLPRGELGREGRAWLVTGGMGGLGLEVAKWLAERGARSLVLNGRRPPGPAAEAAIEALRERGVDVRVELADLADEAAVAGLMARIDAAGRPLAGLFHCAGGLADGALADQEAGRFRRVLAPKVAGAWHLHRATRQRELDHFVLFSSIAGALGNAGQANYAAANAWLDQLARYRRARGLAGQSIAWGPWAGVGMAQDRRERIAGGIAAAGLGWLSPRQGIAALDRIVGQDVTSSVVADADWATLAGARQEAPLFEPLTSAAAPSGAAGPASLMPQLRAAPAAERPGRLASFLQREIQEVLMLPDPPSITTGFLDLGLNSLMAVEVRNRLNRALAGAFVAPSTILFDFPDVKTLASHVLAATGLAETGGEERRDSSDLARIRRRIDSLSDEEFLAETLAKMGDA